MSDSMVKFVFTLAADQTPIALRRGAVALEQLRRAIERQRVRVVRGDRCDRRRRRSS